MPLMGRVINISDPDSLVQALRDIIDSKPIGPVQMTTHGNQIVLLFDSAVGSLLTTGTNAAIGTTATQLTQTPTVGREIIVQADPANASNVLVGGATGQTLVLVAGASLALDWTDMSTIWAKSAAGTMTVNWIVRG